MFFPMYSPPAPATDQEVEEEQYTVQLRKRSYSNPSRVEGEVGEAVCRPRTWSRPPDNLHKIDEKEDETDASNPRTGYNLSGYLYKISSHKKHVPSLKGLGSHPKKRWFVYSDSVCKLYYYKEKNSSQPLGVIDIALASFFFDPENKNDGQFCIRWSNKEVVLEAASAKARMYWLQNLQAARREFSQRRTATNTPASRTTSTMRPEAGLIQEDNAHVASDTPDPHHDLQMPMIRPLDSDLPPRPQSSPLSVSRLSLSNLLPQTSKIFKGSNSSDSLRSPTGSPAAHNSIPNSPTEDLSFGNLGRRLRSSLRVRKSHEGKEVPDVTSIHKATTCKKCEELQAELKMVQEEHTATQDEYQASREVINVLQKELETLQQEKATLISLDRSDLTDHHVIEILRGKDRRIVQLEHETQMSAKEITQLQEELSKAQLHHEHLDEKLSMMYCLVEAKDRAIVSLTHEIDAVKSPTPNNYISLANSSFYSYPSSSSSSYSLHLPEFVTRGTQTIDLEEGMLKDSLEAYKAQNLFLNKEILELNLLRKHAADREDKLITESSEWEAKFYQIQSKYLLLLNELHSPQANQHDHSIVSQLLQDVVRAHDPPALKMIQSKGREYDEYGFCITAPDDGTLEAKAAYLQKQSQALAHQVQQGSSSWESKWESFLAGTSAKELPTCPELKYLIREGIPYQYKGKVWRLLIDAQVQPLKAAVPSSYYEDLLARHTPSSSTLDPATKQIELDLLRTLPNNRHYETLHSDGIAKLRRVLLAFSRHNSHVGYCQGLNRLAAIALLFLNEEDAFWCLVYIVEYLMPADYYDKHLLGSQVDQRVLKDLVAEKLPRLSNHLARHGLDISLFTFNWFLCVYIDIIPPVTYLTIWDSFLYEGSKVLFRYALAIFKLCEEGILERCDYMEIFSFLRSVPDPITDIPKLQEVAFNFSLSKQYLRSRRAHHIAIVKAELAEVEAVRRAYHASKAAKEEQEEAADTRPHTPENSPPYTDEEGECDADCPSSPTSPQTEGGLDGEGECDADCPSSPTSPQTEGGLDGEGECDADWPSSPTSLQCPSSPTSPQTDGGLGGEGGGGLHFDLLRPVVFERKDDLSHKIDEASVEAGDKGRE